MAIQTVNLTVPGGDTPRSANTKINANFTNTDHAASRLIGNNMGQVPIMFGIGLGNTGLGGARSGPTGVLDDHTYPSGFFKSSPEDTTAPESAAALVSRIRYDDNVYVEFYTVTDGSRHYFRGVYGASTATPTYRPWLEFYHTGNTTKEAGTGYLVASSPVLKVQHDNFEKVHEAEQLDIDVQHLETGVYAITGTTGLRDNDGWYLKPPRDTNGNVLCICEATQDGDVITLKTYKKKFDFETVSIVADYEQPTDIPDGAEVMLRFNDLPEV